MAFPPEHNDKKPAPSKQTKKQNVRTNQPCTDVMASEMASVGGRNGRPHRCEFLGRGRRQREEDGSLEAGGENKQKRNGIAWSFIRKN